MSGGAAVAGRLAGLHPVGAPVHPIGLGCAWLYGNTPPGPDEVEALIETAVAAGINILDTADSYGPFVSESLLGAVVAPVRSELIICTKGGYPFDTVTKRFRANGRPEYLRECCHASLERLGVDEIDLYYLHRVDPAVPLEESWGALAELAMEGKVRALGICQASLSELSRAERIYPISAVQSELSLWSRSALAETLPWCRSVGASFVAFAPLGRGHLTGAVEAGPADDDYRNRLEAELSQRLMANQTLLSGIAEVAKRRGVTQAQVALAWVLAQQPHVFAIPGSGRGAHVRENAAAAQLELTSDDVLLLDSLSADTGQPDAGSARAESEV